MKSTLTIKAAKQPDNTSLLGWRIAKILKQNIRWRKHIEKINYVRKRYPIGGENSVRDIE